MSSTRNYTVTMTITVEEDKTDEELDDIAESFLIGLENTHHGNFSVELSIADHGEHGDS
jgi:hypothetical protein